VIGLEETASSEYKGKTEFSPDALGIVASSRATEDLIASPRAASCWEGDSLHAVPEERQELRACQVAARALVLMPRAHQMPAQFPVLTLAAYPRLSLAFLGWGSCHFWKPPLPGAIMHCFDPGFHTQRRC
jgi:hypothetical protein